MFLCVCFSFTLYLQCNLAVIYHLGQYTLVVILSLTLSHDLLSRFNSFWRVWKNLYPYPYPFLTETPGVFQTLDQHQIGPNLYRAKYHENQQPHIHKISKAKPWLKERMKKKIIWSQCFLKCAHFSLLTYNCQGTITEYVIYQVPAITLATTWSSAWDDFDSAEYYMTLGIPM
jgi:hypothetical protein